MNGFIPPDSKGSPDWFSNENAKLLIRARLKSELPKGPGLYPARFECGVFKWRWWGLTNQWGEYVTEAEFNKPKTTL